MATEQMPIVAANRNAAHDVRYRWAILGVCWIAYIVAFMPRLSIGPLAPFLKKDLSLSNAELGLFMAAAAFGYMLTLLPAGWLVDRIGPRPILAIGEVVGGIFLAGMFMIRTYTQGIILMTLAGTGMGLLTPSTTRGVIDWFPSKERATAMGLKQTAINICGILTGATLPAVAIYVGWKYSYVGLGIIAVAVGVASLALYRQPSRPEVAVKIMGSPRPDVSMLAAFKRKDIWMIVGAGTLLNVVEFSSASYFVLYARDALLFSVVNAGFLFSICQAGGALGKPLVGIVSDRILKGSRRLCYLALSVLTLVTCIMFVLLPRGFSNWLVIWPTLIFGLASAGWGGLHLTMIGELAGSTSVGTVTGLATVFMMLGNLAGPPIFGYILDTTSSFQMAWCFLAVLSLLSTLLLLFVREDTSKA
jgi:ACS family hexuronate transporter-like MFS transporter